jgi:asparagine synthetase B (glutamine-hydrolysing)
MRDAMAHRGPDSAGVLVMGNVGLVVESGEWRRLVERSEAERIDRLWSGEILGAFRPGDRA